MKYKLILFLLFLCGNIKAQNSIDSLKMIQLELKYQILEDRFKEVKRDQLNYSIEKDIYKEVYKNNFERINITITFVLGLFGVLGFIGIRNISTIKKDYSNELQSLKELRQNFEIKIHDFSKLKENYDNEIKIITETNITQNNKIQLLELKEKIKKKIKNDELTMALETSLVALEIAPKDISLLKDIGKIYCRQGEYKDSIRILKKVNEIDPENSSIADLIEIYYFNNQIETAKKIMKENTDWVSEEKKENIIKFFNVIDIYHNKSIEDLKNIITAQIDVTDLSSEVNRFSWDFEDIHHFHKNVKYPEKENMLIRYIWYLKGDYSGQLVLDEINNVS
jgi:tetratricopeptide (TPR) repeat protein